MRRRVLLLLSAVALLGTFVHPARGAAPAPPLGVPDQVGGPSWLHAPPASHPIVENRNGWRAEPILVSGVEAYRGGEYLFQDFVYDAYGANTTDLPLVPPDTSPSSTTGLAGAPTGDVVHPTDAARYGGNAADLLEVRTRLTPGGLAYRVTLNTMLEPDAAIVAIGIDTDRDSTTGRDDWGAGIGELGSLGLEHVVLAWGTGATLDGQPIPASVDVASNQIDLRLPLPPNGQTWRHYLLTGIHDPATHGFTPVAELPDQRSPGGAHSTAPPPVLNVGFRTPEAEPMGTDVTELGGRGVYGWGSWREHAQAKALAARDISAFRADIDFGKVAARVESSTEPATGYLNRLHVSHLDLGEGIQSGTAGDQLRGAVQPYALHIPAGTRPEVAAPFTLLLHAAACNYNQYGGQTPQLLEQLDQARGSIVATPMARGATVGYAGVGEVDTFEVWADVARRYRLDFDRVALSGISMGGIGSFRLASLYPDLFVRAFPIAGHGNEVIDLAENLRNVPLLMWNGVPDELVRVDQYLPYQQRLEALGYRHEQDLFPLVDHLVRPLGTGTDFTRGVRFLGRDAIDRAPRHVTYRVLPGVADPELGLDYDGAYWVDGLRLADGAALGQIDAVDLAGREGAPVATAYREPGTDPEPHIALGVRWAPTASIPRNALSVRLDGLRAVTLELGPTDLDVSRAVRVEFDTTHRVTVTLVGVRRGSVLRVDGVSLGPARSTTVVLTMESGRHVVTAT